MNDDKIALIAIAKVNFPDQMVIAGGSNNGSSVNPFDAVGLKSLYDLSEKMAKKNVQE